MVACTQARHKHQTRCAASMPWGRLGSQGRIEVKHALQTEGQRGDPALDDGLVCMPYCMWRTLKSKQPKPHALPRVLLGWAYCLPSVLVFAC